MPFHALIARLGDQRGTMAIETALIAPLLALMALGVFEVTMIVSREQQLQSAANEASEIILAAAGGSGINSTDLETIIETSLGVGNVTIVDRYRCGTATALTSSIPTPSSGCPASTQVYSYVQLTMTDTYVPMWTKFGVAEAIHYTVVRTVQVS